MEKIPQDPNMDRRGFLRNVLITGLGAAALSLDGYFRAARATPEKNFSLEAHRAWFKKYFASNPKIFENISKPEMHDLVESMKLVSEESLKGTPYDLQGLSAGSVVLSDKKVHGNGIVVKFYVPSSDKSGLSYRYVQISARHVVAAQENGDTGWTHHPKGLDVSVRELSAKEAASHKPLFLGKKRANSDLSGEIVSVLGTDTDKVKRYPAVLSPKMSEHAYRILQLTPVNWMNKSDSALAPHLRMIVLPKGEGGADAQGNLPAQGMSGSPLLYVPDGARGVEIAGIFIQAGMTQFDGEPTDVGFVFDQAEIWRTIEALPTINETAQVEWKEKAFKANGN